MNILPGRGFSQKDFISPPLEFNVSYGWVWNAPVTREGIDERLDEFVEAGIKSLYILPLPKDFRPERLRTFMSPEYLTEEFFDLVEYAVRGGSRRGIEIWIYDEGGWPSGGACYETVRKNPAAMLKCIGKRSVSLTGDVRFKPGEDFIALFDGKRRLPDNYIANRDVVLTEYFVKKEIENGNRVDNTSLSATETFIENTYEAYKARVGDLFGEALPLFFTDEPGVPRNALAENEIELFIKEYGYDLRDYIYVVEGSGELAVTDAEIKARIDHFVLLGKLFRENTCRALYDWCERNGVYYSGHLDLDNRPWGGMAKGYFSHIDLLRKFHVPGIDVIWEQIRYPYGDMEAVDDETLGYGFFPRLASSAARQEGRNLALTETFSIYGDGVTPDEIRYAINYQAIRGINVFNFLNLPYGKSRLAALMMRPAFCPEKPGFYNLKHIHEYYSRLSYLTRLGHAEGDTALYIPCRDYCADCATCDEATVSYKAAGTALEAKNIPFDIIDDGVIRDAVDTGDGLKIGDAIYRHIVVPECKYMPEDVKAKIAPYLGEGAPVFAAESKKLRFMTRKLDTGRLIFVFNEGKETVCEKLELGSERLYALDPASGEIRDASGAETVIGCGDIAVYYATDEELATVSGEGECVSTVGELKAVGYRQFKIDYYGISSVCGEGMPVVDEAFSGEVSFVADYELDGEPMAGERYRILLDGFSVSACVEVGGERITLGMTPMAAVIDGKHLKKRGEIRVTVANTAANEILAKQDVILAHPAAEVGSYNAKMPLFESRRAPLTVGKIRIEKMK